MFPSDKEHWQELFRQFGSYVIVGGSGAIMEWCCFAGLVYFTRLSYLWSTIIAFVIGLYFNWMLGRAITFKDVVTDRSIWQEMCQIFMAGAIGLILNVILMYGLVEYYGMVKIMAKITATFIVFLLQVVRSLLFQLFQRHSTIGNGYNIELEHSLIIKSLSSLHHVFLCNRE